MSLTVVNGYTTVDDLRTHLGDIGTKLDEDSLIRAINASSRAIDVYCNRRRHGFWKDSAPVARRFRVSDCYTVDIDDIASADGVIVQTDDACNGSFSTTWADSEFELGPEDIDLGAPGDEVTAYAFTEINAVGSRTFPYDYWRNRPTLKITAQYGWSAVPDDVTEACLLKAASLFRRKDAPFGVAGFTDFGPVRITRKDPDVCDLLSGYERKLWA